MLTIVQHSLLDHYLTILRDKTTPSDRFRAAALQVGRILAAEATRDLDLRPLAVETPLEPYEGREVDGAVVVVPILRAGLALVDAVCDIVPNAVIGHIGLQRDELTAKASSYYDKLPKSIANSTVILLDPMLATGGSACMALDLIEVVRPARVKLVTVVSAPEGLAAVEKAHPDVHIYTAALDRGLNAAKFILPGLGDFGDRVCNT